jgi:predicted Zn-dependent protease
MEADPYETTDVLDKHPDVAARLQQYAERHRRQFYTPTPAS